VAEALAAQDDLLTPMGCPARKSGGTGRPDGHYPLSRTHVSKPPAGLGSGQPDDGACYSQGGRRYGPTRYERQWLTGLLGEERVKAIETAGRQAELEDAGTEFKEAAEAAPVEPVAEPEK